MKYQCFSNEFDPIILDHPAGRAVKYAINILLFTSSLVTEQWHAKYICDIVHNKGKGLRKSLWTPHTQLVLSLNRFPCGQRYRSQSAKTTRQKKFFPPGHILPEQYITHPSTVNNSLNLHLDIRHMLIHSSVYGRFTFLNIFSYYSYFLVYSLPY